VPQRTRRNGANWYIADQVSLRYLHGHFFYQRWLSVELTIIVGTLVGYARCSSDEQDITELISVSCPTVYRTLGCDSGSFDIP
jgi:hypothetical protein